MTNKRPNGPRGTCLARELNCIKDFDIARRIKLYIAVCPGVNGQINVECVSKSIIQTDSCVSTCLTDLWCQNVYKPAICRPYTQITYLSH